MDRLEPKALLNHVCVHSFLPWFANCKFFYIIHVFFLSCNQRATRYTMLRADSSASMNTYINVVTSHLGQLASFNPRRDTVRHAIISKKSRSLSNPEDSVKLHGQCDLSRLDITCNAADIFRPSNILLSERWLTL